MRTHLVMKLPEASLAWGRIIARDDALDTGCLCGENGHLLVHNQPWDDGADEDVDPGESLRELLDRVAKVAGADLDARLAKRLDDWLGDGLRTHECRHALHEGKKSAHSRSPYGGCTNKFLGGEKPFDNALAGTSRGSQNKHKRSFT